MNDPAPGEDVRELELELLLEAIHRRYGFDFRSYARASLRRRVARRMRLAGAETISTLQARVLHDRAEMEALLLDLSINVTSMFRDPAFYRALRETVIPELRSFPFIRIWHAGCSSGEEVYSLAILLSEEGVYDRCRIYATDMNEVVLARAAAGIFPLESMREYSSNYLAAGGRDSLSRYYTARDRGALFDGDLRRNVLFSSHNLASDGPFNEFQLILCRNVMIYFDKELQGRVHRRLYECLCHFGVLGLGVGESIEFTPHASDYERLSADLRLYRRIRP